MRTIVNFIDTINKTIGQVFMWTALFIVLIQFTVVLMRYVFAANSFFIFSSIQIQESITYLHAFLFMIAAAFTLWNDGHVRVDIFYRTAAPRKKAFVNLLGTIFLLLPVCIVIFHTAWPITVESWNLGEGSPEASGIQAVYLLRATINVFAGLMFLQGISIILSSVLALYGDQIELDKLRIDEEQA